jgi:hypothetical protein
MNSNAIDVSYPHCPQCHSAHVTSLSTRTLVLAGVGAGLGCALMAFLMFAGSRDDDKATGKSVSPIIVGILTGAMTGFSYGNPDRDDNAGHGYLCLDCFHHFQWFDLTSD